MTNIQERIKNYSSLFNRRFAEFFPVGSLPENKVVEAMKYSATNGGKRFRPFLVAESAALFDLDFEQTLRTAAAIEALHTYSLIHDDLPAMDNDDLRRGKPTCHKAFDETTAILAGDGLLTYAFQILADEKTHPDAAVRASLVSLLARAAGAFDGMVAGQMLDMYAEQLKDKISEDIIKRIEEMKTGRMISYACRAGALLGKASAKETEALAGYARRIGIAFQISDDILDIEGDQTLVGKTLNKDSAQGKATFVSLYGLEKARSMAQNHVEEAKQILAATFGEKSVVLQELADFIISRKY